MNLKILSVTLSLAFTNLAWADDEDVIDFSTIVEELSGESRVRAAPDDHDAFANVSIHASLGLSTAFLHLQPELAANHNGQLTGFDFSFGVDLFSPRWLCLGSFRSYESETFERQLIVELKEFDTKIIYDLPLSKRLHLRFGGGLAARYLNVRSIHQRLTLKDRYTTPSSLLTSGLYVALNPHLGLSADLSLRSALVDETIDTRTFSGNLNLNTTF